MPVHVIVPMLKKPGSVIADEVPRVKEVSRYSHRISWDLPICIGMNSFVLCPK